MKGIRLMFFFAVISLCWHSQAQAKDIIWDKAGTQKNTGFYPGGVSWEFLNSEQRSLG